MNMQTLEHNGLLSFVTEMKLFISVVLVLYLNKLKKFFRNKNIIANILREQRNDSVKRGYFCIGLIDFMIAGKN